MSILRGENKIAVLLTSLPPAAADGVLTRLGPERGGRLRGLMERVRAEVSPDLIDEVLREFHEMLSRATRHAPSRPRLAVGTLPESDTYHSSGRDVSANAPRTAHSSTYQTSDDAPKPASDIAHADGPIAALRLIDNDRLAAALQDEHPRGVATVLSCLEPGKASDVLTRLSPDVRKDVFTRLGQAAAGTDDVSLRIVRAVVAKSRDTAADDAKSNGDAKAQMMADMLKAMERDERRHLMSALTEHDETLAAAVRDRLYVFDDLAHIEGQSMQKLLAEVDAKTLATALHEAPEDIVDNVMANLSRRARESLTEEISYLGAVSPAQVKLARKVVVDVVQRMDQAGEAG